MNLCAYLEHSARLHPGRVAVVDPSGRAWSYHALDDASNRVAGYLAARGIAPGDRVGVIAPKSAEAVAALFGIMKAGAAFVPADYTAPALRNRTLLADCAITAVFLDPSCAAIVDEWPHAGRPAVCWLPGDATPAGGAPWAEALAHAPLDAPRLAAPDGLAYILYTSGSTGVPKGVKLTHRNAAAFVDWCSDEYAPEPEDRFSSHAPFHFDLSVLDLYVSLKHGAALYLVSEQLGKTPQDLAAFIAANRLTMWYSTPSILSLLAQFGALDKHDCSSLRVVNFAGEVFPVKHLRSIVERWPQARFYNLYGPTETNVCTFARIPTPIPPDRTEPYPIGHLCRSLRRAGARHVRRNRGPARRGGPAAHCRRLALRGLLGPSRPPTCSSSATAVVGTARATWCASSAVKGTSTSAGATAWSSGADTASSWARSSAASTGTRGCAKSPWSRCPTPRRG